MHATRLASCSQRDIVGRSTWDAQSVHQVNAFKYCYVFEQLEASSRFGFDQALRHRAIPHGDPYWP